MTRQRQLVLDIVNNSHNHYTAEEIYKIAKEQMPDIVFATIYNNLNRLVEDGFIRRIKVLGNADIYDNVHIYHDHLICQKCGKISDVKFPQLEDILKAQSGVDILSYNLVISYICDDCKSN
ncbi:MAG: transcriptional repressor [Clostridia bacterium]|nr:transcriptional repressor [Clostridia bacterium]